MAGSSIQGITKTLMQVKTSLKAELDSRESEEDLKISFMELMNQNHLSFESGISSGTKDSTMEVSGADSAKTAYDSSASARKDVAVRQDVDSSEKYAESAKELTQYEEDIRDVLKEELGVTDEQVEEAMQTLGLTWLDLAEKQNLTALIQTLTGADVGTLFSSDSFQVIMEQVTELTETLCEALDVAPEELEALSETWKQLGLTDVMPQENQPAEELPGETIPAGEESGSAQEIPADQTVQTQKTDTSGMQENMQTAKTAEQTTVREAADDPKTAGWKAPENEAQPAVETQKMAQDESAGGQEQKSFEHSRKGTEERTDAGMSFAAADSLRGEQAAAVNETVQPYTSQPDMTEVIQQIARNARIYITAGTTSMEMQLNPENLGKIYLHVTEREGIIRAQLAAQNQTVKEALETQLVELRQALDQQGIKVDAIEVTVAAHEFEQNLESSANQQEQMQQQMEETQKQTNRNKNLNRNDLDGLSGLLTEEEQLAARIMKDNGNQVDFTA